MGRRGLIFLSVLSMLFCGYGTPFKAMAEKRAVMIIAPKDFRDEELQRPKEILEKGGVKVAIASPSLKVVTGMLGAKVKPDIQIRDLRVVDFDAIIFVGGMGASYYWENPMAHKIAQEAVRQNKILCAICIAPVILSNSGVLKGKKATVWSSESKKIEAKGAIFTGRPVEIDGKIITANGPGAAEEFGRAILRLLTSEGR